jgi:hypothetical protein
VNVGRIGFAYNPTIEQAKKLQEQAEKTTKEIEGVVLPDQLKRLKEVALHFAFLIDKIGKE